MIQLKANLADVTRLLIAQQVARAANIQIVAGELEPRTQTVQIAQHLEPLFGNL